MELPHSRSDCFRLRLHALKFPSYATIFAAVELVSVAPCNSSIHNLSMCLIDTLSVAKTQSLASYFAVLFAPRKALDSVFFNPEVSISASTRKKESSFGC